MRAGCTANAEDRVLRKVDEVRKFNPPQMCKIVDKIRIDGRAEKIHPAVSRVYSSAHPSQCQAHPKNAKLHP